VRAERTEGFVGICHKRQVHHRVTLVEFSRVDIHLHHPAHGCELLPVETGLLKAEAGAERDDAVRLRKHQVGTTLAPGVGASYIQLLIRAQSVGAIPRGLKRNTHLAKRRPYGIGGLARHTAPDEQDRALSSGNRLSDRCCGILT